MTPDKQIQELVEALKKLNNIVNNIVDSDGMYLGCDEHSDAMDEIRIIRSSALALLAENKRYREALENLPEFNEDGVVVLYSIAEIKAALNPSAKEV